MALNNRRLGLFSIAMHMLENNPRDVCDMMRGLRIVIIKADYDLITDKVNYVGLCDKFDVVGDGEAVREYTIMAHEVGPSCTRYEIV